MTGRFLLALLRVVRISDQVRVSILVARTLNTRRMHSCMTLVALDDVHIHILDALDARFFLSLHVSDR
jgi:hypothetical protein